MRQIKSASVPVTTEKTAFRGLIPKNDTDHLSNHSGITFNVAQYPFMDSPCLSVYTVSNRSS